jgi:hypothetical protein
MEFRLVLRVTKRSWYEGVVIMASGSAYETCLRHSDGL